jgi:hypothetical protein
MIPEDFHPEAKRAREEADAARILLGVISAADASGDLDSTAGLAGDVDDSSEESVDSHDPAIDASQPLPPSVMGRILSALDPNSLDIDNQLTPAQTAAGFRLPVPSFPVVVVNRNEVPGGPISDMRIGGSVQPTLPQTQVAVTVAPVQAQSIPVLGTNSGLLNQSTLDARDPLQISGTQEDRDLDA